MCAFGIKISIGSIRIGISISIGIGIGFNIGSVAILVSVSELVSVYSVQYWVQGRLPPMVVFQQRASSNKGLLPPKVISHLRLSSPKGRLPLRSPINFKFLFRPKKYK